MKSSTMQLKELTIVGTPPPEYLDVVYGGDVTAA
jgi:hypothetical protein